MRRRYLTLLVLIGVGQAVSAGVAAYFLTRALGHGDARHHVLLLGVLVAVALGVGALHAAERVLAEKLGQDYVHQIRMSLIRGNVQGHQRTSLGVTVTRTSNDLMSVKNWVSFGIAPVAVALPLIGGALVVLALISPVLVIGLAVPLALLAVALMVLAPRTFDRTRDLRRARGRLAALIADTVMSARAIGATGGAPRELRRIDRRSRALRAAAIHRAVFAGALRGSAATAASLTTAMIVVSAMGAGLQPARVTTALAVAGFLATPIYSLGQAAEYRQAYRAAARIIGPAIEGSTPSQPEDRFERSVLMTREASRADVTVVDLMMADATSMPTLMASPGDRILVDAGNRRATSSLLALFAGLGQPSQGQILIHGADVCTAGERQLRRRVGYAAQGMSLVRGTVRRNVLYRRPQAGQPAADEVVEEVGMTSRVASLPNGIATLLRHGGQPLDVPERARINLARAILGRPPLLVLDHLDADLGVEGRSCMRSILATYPGIVLLASDDPEQVINPTHVWKPGGLVDAGVSTGGMDIQRHLARETPDRPADCRGDAESG